MVTISQIELPNIPLFKRGKVRDIFDLGDKLLIVATDRISAFDVVMPNPIPDKGRILTALSVFWFNYTRGIIDNHLITDNAQKFPSELEEYKEILEGRSMLVKKAKPIGVECVVRGYISGGGFKEYKERGSICGIPLPGGLREAEALPHPIFTPSTKAKVGHDINITFEEVKKIVGEAVAKTIKEKSIEIYKAASKYAGERGIIIADTKFEFGEINGKIILIDEILTPDSSRFWPKKEYRPGKPQPSFDKQYLRDYLESLPWDKKPPAPNLPEEIIEKTRQKYLEAYKTLIGGISL